MLSRDLVCESKDDNACGFCGRRLRRPSGVGNALSTTVQSTPNATRAFSMPRFDLHLSHLPSATGHNSISCPHVSQTHASWAGIGAGIGSPSRAKPAVRSGMFFRVIGELHSGHGSDRFSSELDTWAHFTRRLPRSAVIVDCASGARSGRLDDQGARLLDQRSSPVASLPLLSGAGQETL